MALPVTFATLPTGNESLAALDTQFAAIGAIGVIPCACAGTNALTLTPNANTPTISGYTDLAPSFVFSAAATTTSNVTIDVAGLGARNAYKWNGQQTVGFNDLISGGVYKATFLTALNSGAGGFVVDAIGLTLLDSEVAFVIDGGGSAITTGIKGIIPLPFAATVTLWSIMADQAGSITVDLLRANNAVPSVSMVGAGTKPNLSAQQYSGFTAPVGWTSVTLLSADWLAFNVTAATTVTRVTVNLSLVKL